MPPGVDCKGSLRADFDACGTVGDRWWKPQEHHAGRHGCLSIHQEGTMRELLEAVGISESERVETH